MTEEQQLKFQNVFNAFIDEVIINSKNHGNWPRDTKQAYDDFIEEVCEFDAALSEDEELNPENLCKASELADIFLSGMILASKLGIDIPAEIVKRHNMIN